MPPKIKRYEKKTFLHDCYTTTYLIQQMIVILVLYHYFNLLRFQLKAKLPDAKSLLKLVLKKGWVSARNTALKFTYCFLRIT